MIVVQNLYKGFGSQQVLRNISLEFEDGKITAVVGPSGVGKSVLLKIIMGLIRPDSGLVRIGSDVVTDLRSEEELNRVRRRLGVLFQGAALFDSMTVFDNIAFPLQARGRVSRKEIRRKVLEIADALGLDRYMTLLPGEISMGTRKRVGLARALITSPEIVLFDEPNTFLDPLVGQEVYDLIKLSRERWKFTGIVISHELPEVFQVSDRVVMLLQGQVVFDATPEEMLVCGDPRVVQFLQGKTDGPIQIQ
jgi:phospholipid/cholesterol/gamma-HCH transport system ATP-binding protein